MKSLIAVIGGSALVVMGALTVAVAHQQAHPMQLLSSNTMNIGATSTISTPPSTPETAVAKPAVKAGK